MDTKIETSISSLLMQKNYPCVAAVQSFLKKDYIVDAYKNFGEGTHSYELGRALLDFRKRQQSSKSPFMSFWAVFEDDCNFDEAEFEIRMWKELSFMTSYEEFTASWDPHFSKNPKDKNFCFSLDGSAYYVLGLHSHSSRLARRFPYPALIFNLYDQFRALMNDNNDFAKMVHINRRREQIFQGNLNPMVEKYGEIWESIQFSGRDNPPEWTCPFQFALQREQQQ